jgi:hypothetical protein
MGREVGSKIAFSGFTLGTKHSVQEFLPLSCTYIYLHSNCINNISLKMEPALKLELNVSMDTCMKTPQDETGGF